MTEKESVVQETQKKRSGRDGALLEQINSLFRKYKVTESEKKIFIRLRKDVKELKLVVNYEETICSLIAKKTYKKTLDLLKKFSKVIEEHKIGRKKLTREIVQVLKQGYMWSDPRTKGKNGEVVLNAKITNLNYDTIDDDQTILDADFLVMYRLLIGNPEASRNGMIIVSDLGEVDIKFMFGKGNNDFRKRMVVAGKVPMRLKKYVILHPPWYIDLILNITKTFTSKKIMGRMTSKKTAEDALKYVTGLHVDVGGKLAYNKMEGLKQMISRSEEDERLFDEVINEEETEGEADT